MMTTDLPHTIKTEAQPNIPALIVLYDGQCSFCNGATQWIIARDRTAKVSYAAIEGELGQLLIQQFNIPSNVDSLICIDNNKAYLYSSGAIRVTKYLDGAWKLFYLLTIIPTFIRNPVYRFIAKNRYRWFGKQQSCLLPTPEIRRRFLD
ncbi:thiol-disulfide oxidoreductase DCC family protein [Paenibacillus endoradicis]|uniref:thiol-disulfide oxidoreductase DCC family protein n=1 Tax=Paenibacillus endoradicis TaxID=2972487 RepID=UPI0021591F31|nr:DCC1-like thiol-disulfide oxidoreductase family protein [Paenibacillus endoradicis]MCR8656737.1 DCC1-like thiol-disulfide oxidoreductase family protein [Paenibacillus endoradicis]